MEKTAKPKACPPYLYRVAPALAHYTDDLLFGEIWPTQGLALRDRSLITIAALLASGRTAQIRGHGARGLDNGLSPVELDELVCHMAFYTGWPSAMSAAAELKEIYDARGIEGPGVVTTPPHHLPKEVSAAIAECHACCTGHGIETLESYTAGLLSAEIWCRGGLSLRDRAFASVAGVLGSQQQAALPEFFALALRLGVTREELSQALTQLAFYLGWFRVCEAARILARL